MPYCEDYIVKTLCTFRVLYRVILAVENFDLSIEKLQNEN